MPTYAEYSGAVFPLASQVANGIDYGPKGSGVIGTFAATVSSVGEYHPAGTSYAKYYGAKFPSEAQVEAGVSYGPYGDDATGTLVPDVAGGGNPYQPIIRYIDDAQPIIFVWTDGDGKNLIAQRSFNGAALADTVGTITQTGVEQVVEGMYKLNYSSADRVIGTVWYKIEDADDDTKTQVLVYSFLPSISQQVVNGVLSGLDGVEPRPVYGYNHMKKLLSLVQRDDYNANSGTHVDIPVNLPTGVDADTATVTFRATGREDETQVISLDLSLAVVAGKHFVRFQASASAMDRSPQMYDWQAIITESGTLRRTTVVRGELDLAKAIVP